MPFLKRASLWASVRASRATSARGIFALNRLSNSDRRFPALFCVLDIVEPPADENSLDIAAARRVVQIRPARRGQQHGEASLPAVSREAELDSELPDAYGARGEAEVRELVHHAVPAAGGPFALDGVSGAVGQGLELDEQRPGPVEAVAGNLREAESGLEERSETDNVRSLEVVRRFVEQLSREDRGDGVRLIPPSADLELENAIRRR